MTNHGPLDVDPQSRTKPRYGLMGLLVTHNTKIIKLGHQMQLCKFGPTCFLDEGGAVHLGGGVYTIQESISRLVCLLFHPKSLW